MSEYEDLRALVEFRPLDRPLSGGGERVSPFSASWSTTVADLERELRMLGAHHALMLLDMPAGSFRRDGLPRADRRAYSPGVVLTFKAGGLHGSPDLRYEVNTFTDWRDNVRAIALGLEALRAVDRYGVTKSGQQYQGWAQLEAGVGEGDPNRGRELVERAGSIREALKLAHPDHGGEPDDFRNVIAYRESLPD